MNEVQAGQTIVALRKEKSPPPQEHQKLVKELRTRSIINLCIGLLLFSLVYAGYTL